MHGAPLATPGPTPDVERDKAVERAENYSGKTVAEGEEELTEWIDDKTAEKVDEAEGEDGVAKKPAARKTARSSSSEERRA